MRIFLEIFKEQSDEEIEKGIPQEFIRKEVDELSEDDIINLKNQIVQTLGWSKYKAQIHYCYHDEDSTKPCEIEEI
jgi:hypothetical protein